MIKFLISIIILTYTFSCKDIKNTKINTKVNDSIKKIENIVQKKEKNDQIKNKVEKKNESIFYYVGEPYFIEGVKYTPSENYSYSEIGLSTYYGKELHNIKTINNDFNKVTELLGRHKTLPIPSMVKITNLDNGLSINIKIIDRHDDNASLIQVSRKVAQLLGFYKDKIATVRVDILADSSKQWKSVATSLNEPNFEETISSAPTEIVSITDLETENFGENISSDQKEYIPIELSSEPVDDFNIFLKVSNFNNYEDIKKLMANLTENLKYTSEKNGTYYDIIMGPLDKIEINNLVSYFISKGYKDTKIIVN